MVINRGGAYMSVYKDSKDEVYISKFKDEQLVFGWANVAILEDGENRPIDWDGDEIDPDVLEKAAYNFVLNFGDTGVMHEGESVGKLVESVMFTEEKMEAMGIPKGILPYGWWVGFKVLDADVFQKVKDGTYNMFSIQGTAIKNTK